MKQKMQIQINNLVTDALTRMGGDYHKIGNAKRLRSSQATVFETDNFYVLVSYATTVACIEKSTDTLYDFLRYVYEYTATSAQHISKFEKDYSKNGHKCEHRFRYCEI